MYAIIESGSKQYRVETGDQVDLELLESAEDGSVDFDRVLAVGDGDDVEFGTPLLENASVTGRLIQEGPRRETCRLQDEAPQRLS